MRTRGVYRTTLANGKTAGYYYGNVPENAAEDYISVAVPSEDCGSKTMLQRQGFCFAERSIMLEFPIRNFRSPMKTGKKYMFCVTQNWQTDEVFAAANGSFDNDCRFSLDAEHKDKALSAELLAGFVSELRKQRLYATLLYSGRELVGFNLWRTADGAGRIMLGAMSAERKNTGVAAALYAKTLEAMCENGAECLRDYIGSSNVSSINLHMLISRYCQNGGGNSARFGNGYDYFIADRKTNKS